MSFCNILISPCCGRRVKTVSTEDIAPADYPVTTWYECEECGQPCDPVPASTEEPAK